MSSIDPKEKEVFSSYSWWHHSNPLHPLSSLRIEYILRELYRNELKGLKILDVGCGGGLMTERFAELGANVTGIDPTDRAIEIAKRHLPNSLFDKVTYLNADISEINDIFDLVLASEVIEHVNDQNQFMAEVSKRVKKEGDLFLSTVNKTFDAWFAGIIVTEKILNTIDEGTHNYDKFVEPEVLSKMCLDNGLITKNTQGWIYNPLTNNVSFTYYSRIGYMMHCKKL
jgi:ubiquinone biosynthesis O-methyltransferase